MDDVLFVKVSLGPPTYPPSAIENARGVAASVVFE